MPLSKAAIPFNWQMAAPDFRAKAAGGNASDPTHSPSSFFSSVRREEEEDWGKDRHR